MTQLQLRMDCTVFRNCRKLCETGQRFKCNHCLQYQDDSFSGKADIYLRVLMTSQKTKEHLHRCDDLKSHKDAMFLLWGRKWLASSIDGLNVLDSTLTFIQFNTKPSGLNVVQNLFIKLHWNFPHCGCSKLISASLLTNEWSPTDRTSSVA